MFPSTEKEIPEGKGKQKAGEEERMSGGGAELHIYQEIRVWG